MYALFIKNPERINMHCSVDCHTRYANLALTLERYLYMVS